MSLAIVEEARMCHRADAKCPVNSGNPCPPRPQLETTIDAKETSLNDFCEIYSEHPEPIITPLPSKNRLSASRFGPNFDKFGPKVLKFEPNLYKFELNFKKFEPNLYEFEPNFKTFELNL
jgi:hypothetical protein